MGGPQHVLVPGFFLPRCIVKRKNFIYVIMSLQLSDISLTCRHKHGGTSAFTWSLTATARLSAKVFPGRGLWDLVLQDFTGSESLWTPGGILHADSLTVRIHMNKYKQNQWPTDSWVPVEISMPTPWFKSLNTFAVLHLNDILSSNDECYIFCQCHK